MSVPTVIPMPAPVSHVVWGPGGRWIAFRTEGAEGGGTAVGVLRTGTWERIWTGQPPDWRVQDLEVSPDGRWLAVTEERYEDVFRTVRTRVLRADTGQQHWSSPERSVHVEGRYHFIDAAFGPDSRFLAWLDPVPDDAGIPTPQVGLLDVAAKTVRWRFPCDAKAVAVTAATVVASTYPSLAVIDLETGQGGPVPVPPNPDIENYLVVPGPAGWAALACGDGTIRLVAADGTAGPVALVEEWQWVEAVAFSHDGRWFAGTVQNGVGVYSIHDASPRFPALAGVRETSSVEFSPDLRTLAVNRVPGDVPGGGLTVLDARTGEVLHVHTVSDYVADLAYSYDGTRIAAGGAHADGTGFLHVYDTGAQKARVVREGAVTAVATNPPADVRLIAAVSADHLVTVAHADSGQELLKKSHPTVITAVAFAPDGQWIATGCADRLARLFTLTGLPVWKVSHGGAVTTLAISPGTGDRVATGSVDRTVRMLDRATGEQRWRHEHGSAVTAVLFAPDGTWLATGSADRTTRLLDADTGQQRHGVSQDDRVRALAVPPDGSLLATGNEDGTVLLLDTATGGQRGLLAHQDGVTALAFSPDGAVLASGSADRTVQLTSVTNGQLATLEFDAPVTAVRFSPDGGSLAVVTESAVVRVIGTADRVDACRLIHPGPVRDLAFSADGELVVTGCDDGVVRVFPARWR